MSLTAKEETDNEYEMTPEGQYIGRCYRVLDLGTQTSTNAYGTKEKHKAMISWELFADYDEDVLDEDGTVLHKAGEPIVTSDGRPFSVHKKYTVTLSDMGALRPDLEAWRGKKFTPQELEGFDLDAVIDQYCTIQVLHSDDGKFANVQTIMAYKGAKPKAVNENVVFDIDNPNMEVFNALSENMKAKIMAAPEWHNKRTLQPGETGSTSVVDEFLGGVKTHGEAEAGRVTDKDEDEQSLLDSIPF